MWSRFLVRKPTAALLCCAGLLAAPLAAGATDRATDAGGAAVVIHTTDGDVSIGVAELEGAYDIVDAPYTVRAADGTEDRLQFSGASIRRVFDLAGVDPASVSFLETPRRDGTRATLAGTDLAANPPFADGPPLVFVDGPAVRYLRPVRNSKDSNAADNLATGSGRPLELTTHTGNLLQVKASVTGSGDDRDKALTFEATASGARADEQVAFTWDFGDGSTGSGASVDHTFSEKGTYRIVARAEGDQGSAGSSNLLTISVSPPKGPGEGPGNGSNHDGDALPDGPQFGNGHQSSGGPGAGAPTGGLDAAESTEQGAATDSTSDATAPALGGYTAPLPASPTTPLPSPGPTPSSSQPDPPVPAAGPQGEPVAGRLLGVESPVVGVDPAPPSPPAAAASAAGDPSTSAWTALGLSVGSILLVGAGAALELRGGWGSFRMRT